MSFLLFLGYLRYSIISMCCLIVLTFVLALGIGILPGLNKILFDKVFVTYDFQLLYKLVGIHLYLIFYMVLFTILYAIFESNLNIQISNKVKVNYLRKLLKSQISFFKQHDTGFLVKRIIEDSNAIADGISKLLTILCNMLMIVIFAIILHTIDSWLFTLYTTLILSSFVWMVLWIFPIHWYNMKIGNEYSNLYKLFWEVLQGIKEIKLQNLHTVINKKIETSSNRVKGALLGNTVFNTCMWQYSVVFYALGYISILVYGFQKIRAGEMSIGLMLALLSFVFYILDPVQKIYGAIGVVQAGIAAGKRIKVIRKAPDEKSGKMKFEHLQNGISFNNVSFSYDGKENTLDSICLRIPKGAKVAIVGKTGSGKTTLIQLLLKLYDGYTGTIEIDDLPLEKFSTSSIRKKMVFISQDTQIFNDSIRNNIDFAQVLSDKELMTILQKVNLDVLVSRHVKGVDSKIGAEGVNFSGGERQRISIARCMAADPEIVILDEITASLDPQNEDEIMENLIDHFNNKTIISISHRLSTIRHFDYIYVLKKGKIVEHGTYEEQIHRNGEFAMNFNLVDATSSQENPAS